MEPTWQGFFEGLVRKAGNATKLAVALGWSDTKISRFRAYQGSFPRGGEILVLAAYGGVSVEHVAVLVAKAQAAWLALQAQRRVERRDASPDLASTKPLAKALPHRRLMRGLAPALTG